ncbi:MAG: Bifunctional homocysteine S-methyltransferase/5,10-methylenetetrahydrofolate reductase [Gammaproteobacteria bacterium]|nr:Bifunctional homocysteine S-methyltransferase/5,10-methylenetetrahydrofolate reductase [Gammaproteobacteria bacterium]
MTDLLRKLLDIRPWLLADGATGTGLFDLGLPSGGAPELWNIDYPERVEVHYRSFIDAGSDIVLTNSFGGTRHRLALHQAQDRVYEINRQAAWILRGAIDASERTVVAAGSMGPTGEILQPVGSLCFDDAVAAFSEQARGLREGGVDVLWIETMSSREEVAAAVRGAADTGLPIVTCFSIDTNGRTMMGVSAQDIVALQNALNPAPVAFGTNCGIGAAEVVMAILRMNREREDNAEKPALVAKANCGIPEYIDGKIVYNGTPELMADYARLAYAAGATIIGGCCGTTARHVRAMREALAQAEPEPLPDVDAVIQRLGTVTEGMRTQIAGAPAPVRSAVRRSRRRGRARAN